MNSNADGYPSKYHRELSKRMALEIPLILFLSQKAGFITGTGGNDLVEAVIAHNDFRKPATMSEAFYIFSEEKIISDKLTEKIVRMVGFRNVLAHDYEDIDYDIVYNVLQHGLNDIEVFLRTISKKLNITRAEKKTGKKN